MNKTPGRPNKRNPRSILVADYERRFVWLDTETAFDSSLAEGVIKILNKFDENPGQPITFYIRGYGGDVYAFVKLGQIIDQLKSHVVFVAFDFVRSGCFWITQSGKECLAVKGTKFVFHRAVFTHKNETMSQRDYLKQIDRLKLMDAVQFLFFTRRGRPASKIAKLFEQEATLTTERALRLRLVSRIYHDRNFKRDKKRAEELARQKYGPELLTA